MRQSAGFRFTEGALLVSVSGGLLRDTTEDPETALAERRNYTANSAVDPDRIHFANGRVVKLSRETGRLYLSEGDRR